MHSLFDSSFSGMAGADMYRAWVHPDLDSEAPQPVLQNWSDEDIEMFVGKRPERNK